MKVSITFDKNLKQANKKHWVKQIQNVVDKLNNKSYVQNSPNRNRQYKCEYKFHEEELQNNTPIYEKKQEASQERLIKQLVSIQKVMEDRFSTLAGTMEKLCVKINNIEKRLTVLEVKQHEKAVQNKDFDRQFAQIALRYTKIRKSSFYDDKSSKRNFMETADSVFSSYTRYIPQ